MYKRKIENVFQSWLDTPSHKPLVVKGVRQCGKTSSVVDFAHKHFKHVVYLDFREHPDYKKFFTPNLEIDAIVMRITAAMPNVEIEARETCFVFDEIQDCPRARGSLKYFYLDGRYEVMCTGSLLGVNGYKSPEEKKEEMEAPIPVGFEDIVEMYPMDFEEWLWVNGIKDVHFDYLKKCMVSETPIEEALHDRFRELLHQYVVVGGMPEVVTTFMDTKQIGKVLAVQKRIVDEYKSDMMKALDTGDYEGYETMVEALRNEGVEDSSIKEKIGNKYRDQYKDAYRKGNYEKMAEIEETLDNSGFDFDLNKWENDVDKDNDK